MCIWHMCGATALSLPRIDILVPFCVCQPILVDSTPYCLVLFCFVCPGLSWSVCTMIRTECLTTVTAYTLYNLLGLWLYIFLLLLLFVFFCDFFFLLPGDCLLECASFLGSLCAYFGCVLFNKAIYAWLT